MEAAPASGGTFSVNNSNSYASVVLNTDSTGANWQFQDLRGNLAYGPNSFTGTCSASNGQASVNIDPGQSLFNVFNNDGSLAGDLTASSSVSTNLIAIGPSGVFLAQQGITGFPISASSADSVAGVAEPTSALSTTTVAAGNYLGFLTQASQGQLVGESYTAPGFTSPVSFGQTASSGTTMTGGVFPNDDVTQTPNSDTSITLGTQSSIYNGLYPNATVTMLDPNQNCATQVTLNGTTGLTEGVNAEGYITCTFPAVAVVGNPEGKYVIFLDTFNYTANSTTTGIGAPMQIYLFQQ